ncbi:selenium-dependent molybdenum cofactor biosynthesis protein YqeB [Campylobacter sp. MG1]|uniref:selenium-dependent molybdenum cofactor biosynthesis protein YqeB n=1 Tax=Campylobacter sp. MG1 TaxID=2976332 RepID=UPI00226CC65C|nr:selenium-dependent molybdenum cofactor biosynthesis protein YqeB [Campylobacter sp. MG1]
MNDLVIIRGAGDIATGIAVRLYNSGFKIIMLDISQPSAIRRKVAFSEAIYDDECIVENIRGKKSNFDDIYNCLSQGIIPIIVDENLAILNHIKPKILVDSILAKKNLGTNINMADIVIGIGPGFNAKIDCHAVIETSRGHDLGRVIYNGSAKADTGVPGIIAGVGADRVIHSPCEGFIKCVKNIGDIVMKDEILAYVNKIPIKATISGVLRGIIKNEYYVTKNFKVADIDPRISEQKNCFSVSDKARSVGGGVLEAILYLNKG